MTQLRKRLALDLANTLAGNAKFAPTSSSVCWWPSSAEAQANNLALAFGQAIEHLRELLLQHREACRVGGHNSRVIFDEVAQLRVFLFTDRRLEGNRLLADFLDFTHALGGQAHFLANFFRRRVATELLEQLALNAHELVDGFDHVHRNTNGACLVGDKARVIA